MDITRIFDRNADWARQMSAGDPGYFERLTALQPPELLWVGCADCRIPANVLAGLEPGEVLVHRNVANLVCPSDLNGMAVLQYAVDVLQVKDIVVCGHYGCSGVHQALLGEDNGLADYWLEPLKQLAQRHRHLLAALASDDARVNFLCEENVRLQVANIRLSAALRRAQSRGQTIGVHGWIYGIQDGLLRDLGCDGTCGTP